MNFLRYKLVDDEPGTAFKRKFQHLFVAVGTLLAFGCKLLKGPNPTTTTPMPSTTTTTTPPMCASEHSNVKAMAVTIATVSAVALLLRILARIFHCVLQKVVVDK